MSNDFYNASGYPATRQSGSSSAARSEFTAIANAFAKLPTLTGNGLKWWRTNSAGTAAEAIDNATLLSAIGAATQADVTAVANGLSDHLSDPTAAHAASAINYAGSSGLAATDVEAALDELDTEKEPADANIAKVNAAGTWTQKQTFQNTIKAQQALEKVTITAGAPAATQNFDFLTQAIQYFTANGANNWTLNVRGDGSTTLNSLMAIGESATICVKATMGATPYYASAMTIDGNAVAPKWIGGTAPSAGDASCINIYAYTIIKTADATFTVIASKSKTS